MPPTKKSKKQLAKEAAEEAEQAAGMESISLILEKGETAIDRGPISESTSRRMNLSEAERAEVNAKRRDAHADLTEDEKAELLLKRQAAASARTDERSLQEGNDFREAAKARKAKSIASEIPNHRIGRLEERRAASQAYRDIQAQPFLECITANQTAVYMEFCDEQICRMRYSIDDGLCTIVMSHRIASAALALVFHRFASEFISTLAGFSEKDM